MKYLDLNGIKEYHSKEKSYIDAINSNLTSKINTKANTTDLPNMSLYAKKTEVSSNETDPTVPSFVKSITQANITKWNSALQSESDPTVPSHVKSITSTNITNWNNKVDKSVSNLTNYYTKTQSDAKYITFSVVEEWK